MPVSYDLIGKTAVVTGGAKSIGKAIVERLVASGASVHVWDRDQIELKGVVSTKVDITSRDQVTHAINMIVGRGQRIDVLVNNAGYLGTLHPFDQHEPADWRSIIETNLIGTMQVTQLVLPHMRKWGVGRIVNMGSLAGKEGLVLPHMRKWGVGRIVNMGSLAGKEGLANLAAYSASSAGIVVFTKALGREVANTNIRVNCVAPGPIDTDMIRNLGVAAVETMIADSPMNRLGRVEEVAHMVAWLCSDASNFNTGAVFDMSGGRARY
ncbi:3-oxoacyl-ACP reductase [Mesorhizobium sp. LSJC265A00]|nr:3-oxoacyl-ACP reductase [Mesorhizobium sp. LSJC265A00]